MKCTNCDIGLLKLDLIENLFPAFTCSSCSGNWILIDNYAIWKTNNPKFKFSNDDGITESEFKQFDNNKALICPISGSIMQKISISAINQHKINYSAKAGGLWLYKGEWSYLKKEGLAGSLNTLLTKHQQNIIKQDNARNHFSKIYQEKFGSQSYTKIKELREWLSNHEKKIGLKAYLFAEDPYSANK